MKPTVIYSARQHANEVSITSHILRLGELLATDSAYARLLRKVDAGMLLRAWMAARRVNRP